VPRDELFDLCWGRGLKIEIDPANPRISRTVHGIGYRHKEEE
jgi:hypothetical protein